MDRNSKISKKVLTSMVALRKESVDRNFDAMQIVVVIVHVALRKESVDRNHKDLTQWFRDYGVALRKESVDRNVNLRVLDGSKSSSLSARRAWIEMLIVDCTAC